MKIEIWIMTDKVGSKVTRKIDFDDKDWKEMSDIEKDNAVYEEITSHMMFEWGYKEID